MNRPRGGGARFGWPVLLLSLPAGVAIWSGWVGIGTLCGFGKVQPLPGLVDGFVIDTRITLPVGMETYAAVALRAWLTSGPGPRREYAKWSAFTALGVGAAGQVAYHLMSAAQYTVAPWPVVVVVATLPVAVLGMGAALHHLISNPDPHHGEPSGTLPVPAGVGGPAKTARTAKTLFPQARGGEFWHNPPAKTPTGSAKTPAGGAGSPVGVPRRAAATSVAAGELAARVRALATGNPAWTQAQIASEAQCSVRTVRRHLSTSRPAEPTGPTLPGLDAVPAKTTTGSGPHQSTVTPERTVTPESVVNPAEEAA